jgi:hypothetical protein
VYALRAPPAGEVQQKPNAHQAKTPNHRFQGSFAAPSYTRNTSDLKGLDWKQRKADFVARVPAEVMSEVLARLAPLLGF